MTGRVSVQEHTRPSARTFNTNVIAEQKNRKLFNKACKQSDIRRKLNTWQRLLFFVLAENMFLCIVTYMIYTVHVRGT